MLNKAGNLVLAGIVNKSFGYVTKCLFKALKIIK